MAGAAFGLSATPPDAPTGFLNLMDKARLLGSVLARRG